MSKPFDATTKQLIEARPLDWLHFLGIPATDAELIDTDLSTVTTATDRVIRILSPIPRIVHIELESRRTPDLDERFLEQSVLLTRKHKLLVESVAFLLRRKTQATQRTGVIERNALDGGLNLFFRYRIVRLWEVPVETLLSGGIGLLPLAPLSAVEESRLPDVVRQMQTRIQREVTDKTMADILWVSTFILMGLEFEAEFIQSLLSGVEHMEESSTYQLILARGREEGITQGREEGILRGREEGILRGREEGVTLGRKEGQADGERRTILRIGEKRFGVADAATRATLESIQDIATLETLVDRLLSVESWGELLEGVPQGNSQG